MMITLVSRGIAQGCIVALRCSFSHHCILGAQIIPLVLCAVTHCAAAGCWVSSSLFSKAGTVMRDLVAVFCNGPLLDAMTSVLSG